MTTSALNDTLARIERQSACELGVFVRDLQTGEEASLHADALYPMASTFKVPILVAAQQQIAAGAWRLRDRHRLRDEAKAPGSGILPYFAADLQPSLLDLLTLMIIISDNTATDMVLELLGGPAVVEGVMRQLGIQPLSLKYNCRDLIRSIFPPGDHSDEELAEMARDLPYPAASLAAARTAENNTTSPRAMTALLTRMHAGETGDFEAMLAILKQQQYKQRLGRYLPPSTQVATKTGTILRSVNDCGYFLLPNGAEIALTCFALWEAAPAWNDARATWAGMVATESVIGEIGWAVHEYFAGD